MKRHSAIVCPPLNVTLPPKKRICIRLKPSKEEEEEEKEEEPLRKNPFQIIDDMVEEFPFDIIRLVFTFYGRLLYQHFALSPTGMYEWVDTKYKDLEPVTLAVISVETMRQLQLECILKSIAKTVNNINGVPQLNNNRLESLRSDLATLSDRNPSNFFDFATDFATEFNDPMDFTAYWNFVPHIVLPNGHKLHHLHAPNANLKKNDDDDDDDKEGRKEETDTTCHVFQYYNRGMCFKQSSTCIVEKNIKSDNNACDCLLCIDIHRRDSANIELLFGLNIGNFFVIYLFEHHFRLPNDPTSDAYRAFFRPNSKYLRWFKTLWIYMIRKFSIKQVS